MNPSNIQEAVEVLPGGGMVFTGDQGIALMRLRMLVSSMNSDINFVFQ